MDDDAKPLSGQQIANMQERYRKSLVAAMDDLALRKLALDYAAKLAGEQVRTAPDVPYDVVAAARMMHAFLAEAGRDPS